MLKNRYNYGSDSLCLSVWGPGPFAKKRKLVTDFALERSGIRLFRAYPPDFQDTWPWHSDDRADDYSVLLKELFT